MIEGNYRPSFEDLKSALDNPAAGFIAGITVGALALLVPQALAIRDVDQSFEEAKLTAEKAIADGSINAATLNVKCISPEQKCEKVFNSVRACKEWATQCINGILNTSSIPSEKASSQEKDTQWNPVDPSDPINQIIH